ncbi:RNA polymerase sigma-70 factor (ECF subfamily) [Elusimicrobium posterum]|uniref:RNA polymerase sigma factor n=1 Tax=Elusimicrobium posterum TaxID=3116653 RepID=UPI003C78E0CC
MDQDKELLESFKNGDAQAIGFIIEKYKSSLFTYIKSYVKDDGTAEDIFQEVFLKLINNPGSYKEQGNFKAWLFTLARNKCMDFFRSGKSENTVSIDMEIEEGYSVADTLDGGDKEPLEQMLDLENGQAIYEAFNALPKEMREVLLLRENLSFKEISEVLNCPIGTVLARANRGYKKMQEVLSKVTLTEKIYAR